MNAKQIVESLFHVLEWKADKAFCKCPGEHLHTHKSTKRDLIVALDRVPTAYCFHTSCSAIVEQANYKLRRSLWDQNTEGKPYQLTDEEKQRIKIQIQKKKGEERLRNWSVKHKAKILEKHYWPISDVFHQSPFMNDYEKDDSRILLKLFKKDDVIWIGDNFDSGEGKEAHFQTVERWMTAERFFPFTCPSTFKPGSFNRSNENVLSRPYMVIESDVLTPDESCSLFKWMQSFMTMVAIVFSGNKSFHGWFKFPDAQTFEKLKIILPEMGCDKALFKPSQPVRMPGVKRGNNWQSIYWLDNTCLKGNLHSNQKTL